MALEIKMPQLGLTMTEGVVAQWLKKEGDAVAAGEPIFVVETDKLTNEVNSEASGVLLKILHPEGAEVPVQSVVAIVGQPGEDVSSLGGATAPAAPQTAEAVPAASATTGPGAPAAPHADGGRIKASPLAKRIAADKGIDLVAVAGTGPGGRIVQKDVLAAQAAPVAAAPALARTPDSGRPVRRQRLSAMRRAIGKNMTASWITAPVVTFNRSADVTALAELKKVLTRDGAKISYTDILCKLVANVLLEYPYVNSSLDGDEIVFHNYVNMGVAVALEDGLVVPVILDAHAKGIGKISTEIKEKAARARAGELTEDEMSGGTFTITNLGMFGMESFSPIINQPESAILGVNAIIKTPVELEDGTIAMRPKIGLSLTADHRTVDGAVAAQFLQRICELVETPWKMLL